MIFWLIRRLDVNFLAKKTVVSLCLFVAILFSSLAAQAINVSAYRIYLDEDNRNVSFIIFNREVSHQKCTLSLTHNSFDKDSNLIHLADGVIPENSAKKWIRFSPREFVLTPSQSQTVRFSMRRKANAEDAEYRSYVVIDCGVAPVVGEQDKPTAQVSLQTKLVHSVPIIVRSGRLNATAWFDNFEPTHDGFSFTLNRKGNRSIYGDVEVIDTKSGDVIFFQRNFSIYPESQRFNFTVKRKNIDIENLKFRYIENKEYGGDIVL